MSELVSLREQVEFCDGIIRSSDDKIFHVDRNIMSAASPYFKALYTNSLNPKKKNHEAYLPDISSDTISIIIEFAYTGQIQRITHDNFEMLIQSVDRLQVLGALEICHQFLLDSIDLENSIRRY